MRSPMSRCRGGRERPRKLRLFTVSLVALLGASVDIADRRDELWRSAIRQALFVADSPTDAKTDMTASRRVLESPCVYLSARACGSRLFKWGAR